MRDSARGVWNIFAVRNIAKKTDSMLCHDSDEICSPLGIIVTSYPDRSAMMRLGIVFHEIHNVGAAGHPHFFFARGPNGSGRNGPSRSCRYALVPWVARAS